ncbi:Bud-site selection protein [Dacryopinax primogenitus]|uniref:Bud-site selection protein n=1 Tax=Dacryopinax primogenitus (strain DJM 731) TaxID=1858805 RepID=M5GAT8_DACPD|nr:Bud-site selection protein [Dacryopinax primogenitus]EJU03092.1 Bud-site selection protein [Dacryopinax primogenitus]
MAKAAKAEKQSKKRPREEDGEEKENTRRIKRKIFEKPPVDPVENATRRLRGAQASVLKTAKAAKLFETQRLVKKLKHARVGKTPDEDLARSLEKDLEVVKAADPHDICNEALASRIQKDGQLSHDEFCMAALDIVIPPAEQSKTVPKSDKKGWSRLMSNKKLAHGCHHAMLAIKKDFQNVANRIEFKKRQAEEKEQRVKEGKLSRKERLEMGLPPKSKAVVGEAAGDDEGGEEESDDESVDAMLHVAEDDDAEDDDDDDDGDKDDDDNDEEDDDDDEKSQAKKPKGKDKLPDGGLDAPVDDYEDDDDEGDGPESTFLPSLNTGFIAGSDSDFDEKEEDVDGPQRNNRRGQRARQAIWEKKYGKNANHVKKQREEQRAAAAASERGGFGGRGRGRGAPRGRGGYKPAPGGFDPRNARKGLRGRPVDSGWAGRAAHAGANDRQSHPEPPKPAMPEKPMHPSWQAKKNEKNVGQAVAGQGKKIVFGD